MQLIHELLKVKKNHNLIDQDMESTVIDKSSSLEALPDELVTSILMNLDADSIRKLSRTSRRLRCVCTDRKLWSTLLLKDSHAWSSVSRVNHPDHYPHLQHPMHLHQECSQKSNKHAKSLNLILSNVVKALSHKWRKPRIMIFGDGLDRSGIVGEIILNNTEFRVESMLSGGFTGLGSGLNVSMVNHGSTFNFDFITVYTSAKRYRKRNGWIHNNRKLFESNDQGSEPTERLKLLSSTIDFFIYVNDHESSKDFVHDNMERLHSLYGQQWTKPDSKLAIINCGQGHSAMELANDLQLMNFDPQYKWKVWNQDDCWKSMKECLLWYKQW